MPSAYTQAPFLPSHGLLETPITIPTNHCGSWRLIQKDLLNRQY